MWKLQKPTFKVEGVYKDCISNLRDKELKKRHEQCINYISKATKELEQKFINNVAHTVEKVEDINNTVSTDEFKKLYTDKLVKKTQPGRKYYDQIISLAQYETCPFCAHRDVDSIDHYLPKDIYPQYSISPINLVPACNHCNSIKRTNGFDNEFNILIHPYFNDIDMAKWLFCQIIESDPIAFTFYVNPPLVWGETLQKRIKYHFNSLELNKLYSSQASREFRSRQNQIIKEYSLNGIEGVRYFIADSIESEESLILNSWRLAMLYALQENKWFLHEWLPSHSV